MWRYAFVDLISKLTSRISYLLCIYIYYTKSSLRIQLKSEPFTPSELQLRLELPEWAYLLAESFFTKV